MVSEQATSHARSAVNDTMSGRATPLTGRRLRGGQWKRPAEHDQSMVIGARAGHVAAETCDQDQLLLGRRTEDRDLG